MDEMSVKQGKRSCNPSPKTPKRTKVSSPFFSEETDRKISTDDNFRCDSSDDSNSSFRTAASDFEFCSASNSLSKSLEDPVEQRVRTSWHCEEINRELSITNGRVPERGYSPLYLDRDCIYHSNYKDLIHEAKSLTESSQIEMEKVEMQCYDRMVLEPINFSNFRSNIYSGQEEKFQNIVVNNPESREKSPHVLENVNISDCFRFEAKQFQAGSSSMRLSSEKKLTTKINTGNGLLISALALEFPNWGDSRKTYFQSFPETQTDTLHENSDSIARNELKHKAQKSASKYLTTRQQIGVDTKLDERDFTSFHACEINENIECKLNLEKFQKVQSNKTSYDSEKIQNWNSISVKKLPSLFNSPCSLETEVKTPNMDVTKGFSTRNCVSLISSEDKNNSDKGKYYKRRLLGKYKESISEMQIHKSYSKSNEEIDSVFLTSKMNSNDDYNFYSEVSENKTTKDLSASKSAMKDNVCNENTITKKTKFTREIISTRDEMGPFTRKYLEFYDNNLNSSISMQGIQNLITPNQNNCPKSSDFPQQSRCCSKKFISEPLLISSKSEHGMKSSEEKQELINNLGLRNSQKLEFPCKLNSGTNQAQIVISCSSENKNVVNFGDKKTSFKNGKIRKEMKSSGSTQNGKKEIWKVKATGLNEILQTDVKVVPPLVLQRILAPSIDPSQITNAAKKCEDQRNQYGGTNSKNTPILSVNTQNEIKDLSRSGFPFSLAPKNSVKPFGCADKKCAEESNQDGGIKSKIALISSLNMQNEIETSSRSAFAFSLPPKDNVRRVFELLSPMNRSWRAKNEAQPSFTCKSGTTIKTVSEEVKSALQSISLLLTGNQPESNTITGDNQRGFVSRSKKPISCMEEECPLDTDISCLVEECSPVYTDVNCLGQECHLAYMDVDCLGEESKAGLRAVLKDSLVETPVKRDSLPRKAKTKAFLLIKASLPKKRIRSNRKWLQ